MKKFNFQFLELDNERKNLKSKAYMKQIQEKIICPNNKKKDAKEKILSESESIFKTIYFSNQELKSIVSKNRSIRIMATYFILKIYDCSLFEKNQLIERIRKLEKI